MTPRKRPRQPQAPAYRPGMLLNWSGAGHWSWTEKPCRWCGGLTYLRDGKRHPSHKVCAELAIAEQAADAAEAYGRQTL